MDEVPVLGGEKSHGRRVGRRSLRCSSAGRSRHRLPPTDWGVRRWMRPLSVHASLAALGSRRSGHATGRPETWIRGVLRGGDNPCWVALDIDMWTRQEGRSDLTLSTDLKIQSDGQVTVLFRSCASCNRRGVLSRWFAAQGREAHTPWAVSGLTGLRLSVPEAGCYVS
jgi:hypothetical protein